jgi:eukaryotic-like serine/threonine-protein kinase
VVESVIAGRYRFERRIGSGGMSEVWAATDLELDRTVAVKLLAADADPARFGREARAAASLAHVNVCAVFDYGLAEGRRFMVLEYLPGGSLEDRLATGKPLPDDDTRRIAGEIAAGLAHAHERGVVHRDLKPANILFDAGGRAKIADFGIARAAGATGLTEAGTVLGTAAYISPEQAAGRPATPASDVYAVGVILFRMLTARLPFESQDALALAAMHRDLPPPLVSDFRSDAPPLLESVASASLAKSPADRPQDGSALVTELGGVVSGTSGGGSTAATVVFVPAAAGRRRRLLPVLAVAIVAAAGAGLAIALTAGNETTPAPPTTTQPVTTAPSTASSTGSPAKSEPVSTETTTVGTTEARESTTVATSTTGTSTKSTTTTTTATTPSTTAPATTLPATTTQPPSSATATIATTTEPATSTVTTTEPAGTDTAGATTTTPTTPPG